jgi:hypothetical protein
MFPTRIICSAKYGQIKIICFKATALQSYKMTIKNLMQILLLDAFGPRKWLKIKETFDNK